MYSRHVGTENMDARNDLYRGRWRGLCHAAITQTEICKSTWFDFGAKGTGKTVTLQIMAEEFSAAGVPVFLSDVKSDLAGLAKSGSADFKLHDAFTSRAAKIGFHDYSYSDFPVVFWDLFGAQGHPCAQRVRKWDPCCCPVCWN